MVLVGREGDLFVRYDRLGIHRAENMSGVVVDGGPCWWCPARDLTVGNTSEDVWRIDPITGATA